MDRRRFLLAAAAAAAGVRPVAGPLKAQEEHRSQVASVHSDAVQQAAGKLNRSKVLQMVDVAVGLVTGHERAADAWSSLFTTDDVVAIKVNASGGPLLSTNRVIVEAVTERLAGVGVSLDNVVIYDRTDAVLEACGYVLNTRAGLKCGGIEGHWGDKIIRQGAFRGRLPVILSYCSAVVNVPVLKDAARAGVTVSMKNHFGTISNPHECHGNGCDPYIADVNAISDIRDRQRLIICDATSACYEGGPGADPRFIWRPNRVLAATDPVALDTVGAQMIDTKREEQGLQTLEASGRAPRQLASAATRGLGTNDPARIDLLERSV